MIGLYLATLTPKEENRVLTKHFEPNQTEQRLRLGLPIDATCGCLQMTALGVEYWSLVEEKIGYMRAKAGYRYEFLCERFGIARMNRVIRERILANQARRALASVREAVTA